MKVFIDSADLQEVERWLSVGLGVGVTTNPTILKQAGFADPYDAWRKIISIIQKHTEEPISLSAEVFCDNPDEMASQAHTIIKTLGYPGITIKIPILGSDGTDRLSVVRALSRERISVNCTGCITWFQAFAAARAGARYVSLLYRRCLDAGVDGLSMIRRTRTLIDLHSLPSEIIVGSIRQQRDILDAYDAGAHIITVPPKFIPQLLFHEKSVETQKQFLRDAGIA
jgi:transaldolase